MKVCKRFRILAVALIIVLVASSVVTVDAIADDAVPPPAQTEEPVAPPTGEPVPPAEVLPTDAPVETQSDDVVEFPLPAEITDGESSADDPAPLEQLPENAESALPAADDSVPSEQQPENAETTPPAEAVVGPEVMNSILIGDPIWCPDGVSPVAGNGGCTGSHSSISSLVYTMPEPGGAGVIWIMSGNDTSSSFISIDGNVFTNWRNYGLTIQGGWNGDSAGSITSNTLVPKPMEVINWFGDVTINDIVINGVNSNGLTVQTKGSVTLNDVSSNGNHGIGAELTSTAGNITLTGVNRFDNNDATGAELVARGNVTLAGTNQFNGNGDTGLYVAAGNAVDAQNITANNNGAGHSYGYGAEFKANSLEMSGTNIFNGNSESGLYAKVNGNILIANITANSNGATSGYGAGAELVSSSGSVSLSGLNVFNGNLSGGLSVEAANDISISNALIVNNLDTGAYLVSGGDVVLDCSSVVGNAGSGVDADAPNLTLNGVTLAQNNGEDVMNSGEISFNSNSCFTYQSGNKAGLGYKGMGNTAKPLLPVDVVTISSGQSSQLDCELFSGAKVSLPGGNGAYLSCSLGDTVRLVDMKRDSVPEFLPRGYRFISSFNLTVIKGDQPLEPLGEVKSIWFWNNEVNDNGTEFSQILYWDGTNWIKADDKSIPFLRVYFRIPEDVQPSNLAILYWDGANWVELRDNSNLGSGRFVHTGGRLNGTYFEADVNFIGTFVFVQK